MASSPSDPEHESRHRRLASMPNAVPHARSGRSDSPVPYKGWPTGIRSAQLTVFDILLAVWTADAFY